MHITLRKEHVSDLTDLMLQVPTRFPGHDRPTQPPRQPQRVELRRGFEGLILHAQRLVAAPPNDDQLPRHMVTLLPLFPDNRPLPKWPMTWAPEGRSIRFDIECPDRTAVLNHTAPNSVPVTAHPAQQSCR